MKKVYFTLLMLISTYSIGQTCSQVIYPQAMQQGGSNVHVKSDTTINDSDGSNYYICAGLNVIVANSAGCNYQLENNVTLTINNHNGDVVFAKGNCTIIDNTIEGIVVNKEATSTFSKPNNTMAGIVYNCANMVFDYSQVGGSAPCQVASIDEELINNTIFPNPIQESGLLHIGQNIENASIYNLSGSLIVNFNEIVNEKIKLYGIDKGIYILLLKSNSGQVLSIRLIIE